MDVYISVMDFGTWEPYSGYVIHPDVTDLVIEATGNDNQIDISALNDNIIVVSERDGDIVAYYSTDGLVTMTESPIATGAVNPRIVHTNDLTATCTFIQGGSVYYSTTEDGGQTWSPPEIIDEPENSDVPGEFMAADVCGFGAAWMNSADGNIYFASLGGAPPGAPTITGQLKGKPNVEYEYTFNAVDPDGDDVYYYIDWGDNTNTGWVGTSPSGQDYKVKHTWAKKNTYIITAKAKDVNGLIGPESTLEVSMPRIISINNLFLRFLEQFPHAFPILRHLLGV
jgi:hypothetical protein